jgi:hypothetical protein
MLTLTVNKMKRLPRKSSLFYLAIQHAIPQPASEKISAGGVCAINMINGGVHLRRAHGREKLLLHLPP